MGRIGRMSGWRRTFADITHQLARLAGISLLLAGVEAGAELNHAAEMRDLAARADVQKALGVIEAGERASDAQLIELTEIPAPPFEEGPRAARFAELLREAGLKDVRIDKEGNVLGFRPGAGRDHTVAVVAHLDTVFPAGTDVRVRVSGDRFSAPGVGDNARGLVLLLSMVRALNAAAIRTAGNILFVGSVGEEGVGDLRGVKHLLGDGQPEIHELIAIDGGNDARIVNEAIGSYRYRITFTGPGGHSWGAFGLANPAHALASAVARFTAEAGEYVSSGPRTSFNVGRIGGGTAVNAIPFSSWAEVDLRSEDPARLDGIDGVLLRAVAQALEDANAERTRGDPLTVEVESIGRRPSGQVAVTTPLIQRALAATRHLGIEPMLGSGSTDANVAISRGIPATTISRGGTSGGAHSLDEWWSSTDSALGVQKALLLTLASTGLR